MATPLSKRKNYEIHAITTVFEAQTNANIASWVMQTAMKAKYFAVALYHPDYTLELVRKSGILNINLLAIEQYRLVNTLGRKSGRDFNKLDKVPHGFDQRGCPYLKDAIGYIKCEVENSISGGDHEIVVCRVLGSHLLNADKNPLTLNFLREKKLVRG
jgi:flavin reductase (DIM6/NTAB) family NADH-FMN oxidoreductase RutF